MTNSAVESVYFKDGCVIEKDYIYFASKLKSLDPEEYDYSRMFYLDGDDWIYHDLNWDVVSVCVKRKSADEPRQYCALSMQGDVELQYPGGAKIEKIQDAGTFEGYGALKQIKEIGNHLYACGDQGQVYQRQGPDRWIHIDQGIFDPEISASAIDLNSIDGSSENDLYVVGFNGRIFYRTNSNWVELDSPTNAHLERIKYVSKEEVYICGNKGVFLKGNFNGFTDLSVSGLDDNFWGLEYFDGRVYLATLSGLYVYDGSIVEPVESGITPQLGGYRLNARDGVLWSFGVDDLAYFDGSKWTKIVHPDNR